MTGVEHHLNFVDKVNLGSYYTPDKIVRLAYNLMEKHISNFNQYVILDTSCGYGSFFNCTNLKKIGADIDNIAINKAKSIYKTVTFLNHNSLLNVSRKQYNIIDNDKLLIVGNPPYNDTTSLIRNNIKKNNTLIDADLKTRDLGMSFLLSYNKLSADYICVLHPLSYLIKESNFNLLKNFTLNYKLIDGIIINSQEFSDTVKNTAFPIIIALYKRDNLGMDYQFIQKYLFKTLEGKFFKLTDFDKISNYVTKYPNKNNISLDNTIAFFWTMRDINALKRTKTFIPNENYNSIRVTKDNIEYYCYVDIFKEYIKHIPYYLGNSDIFIDNIEFQKIKTIFKQTSLSKYRFFKHYYKYNTDISYKLILEHYFKNLLGEHYVS